MASNFLAAQVPAQTLLDDMESAHAAAGASATAAGASAGSAGASATNAANSAALLDLITQGADGQPVAVLTDAQAASHTLAGGRVYRVFETGEYFRSAGAAGAAGDVYLGTDSPPPAATYAALRARRGNAGVVVATLGRAAAQDGGEGSFRWLPSGADDDVVTLAAAGGGVWAREWNGGAVDVRWAGAVADGSTDCTSAFIAALGVSAASLYIPAASNYYRITADVTVPDGKTVYGDGYNSQVRVTEAGQNAFVMGSNTEIRGLRVKMPAGNNANLLKQNAVLVSGVRNVRVLDNWLDLAAVAVSGVQIRASTEVAVRGNLISGGGWTPAAGPEASAADILVYSSAPGARIVIDGNYCLSNSSQGIFVDALGFDADVLITGNVVVTLDPATCVPGGTWSEIADGGRRRHSIVLGYNDSAVQGPRAVVSGNLCRNTLWTGIYKVGESGGPTVITGNICSNNGYDTASSLSGGIYVSQNGNELVANNFIVDYRGTSAGVGGITVNANPSNRRPTVIRGNTVRGSLAAGIHLGTRTGNVSVIDNTLIDNAAADVRALSTGGDSTLGGHLIKGNLITRSLGTEVPGILVNPQASVHRTRILDNIVRGVGSVSTAAFNAGIYVQGAIQLYDIVGNEVDGFAHGIYATNFATTLRTATIRLNRLRNCVNGINISATSNNVTVPLVDNAFEGVTNRTAAAIGSVCGRICSRHGEKLVTESATAAPTSGQWEVGDRTYFTAPVAGGNVGAVCTTAGISGTMVWKTFGAIAA